LLSLEHCAAQLQPARRFIEIAGLACAGLIVQHLALNAKRVIAVLKRRLKWGKIKAVIIAIFSCLWIKT
jgi:hypothetical protein